MTTSSALTPAPADPRFGLVRDCGAYRSWARRDGRWVCVHTSDSLSECRRHGSVTLRYPEEPDPAPMRVGDFD